MAPEPLPNLLPIVTKSRRLTPEPPGSLQRVEDSLNQEESSHDVPPTLHPMVSVGDVVEPVLDRYKKVAPVAGPLKAFGRSWAES